jgi:hypothetical protein
MNDHVMKYFLWKIMFRVQQNGSLNENALLDCARYFWYDGYETNESFF